VVAERVRPTCRGARATQPSSEIEAIGVLERWDNTTAVDSRGGTLFANWWDLYYDSGAGKHATPWSAAEPTATPRGLADPARAVQLFAEAVEEVRRVHGRLDVPWGEAHRIRKERSTCRCSAVRHIGLLACSIFAATPTAMA
jgi:acyl-homoserine-lactone acylase